MDEDDIAAERRRAEAAQWFARLKTLPVSQGTLTDFFAWRRHTQNAEAFADAERLWTEAGRLGDRPAIMRAVEAIMPARAAPRRRHVFLLVPAFALLLVGVLVGISWLPFGGLSFQTTSGEQRAVALEDGSRLELNSATKVRVRFSADARHLFLQRGEALFSVAHDTSRPFTVVAGDVAVTATGTRFDVSKLDRAIVVTLVEGHVSIRDGSGPLTWLAPGEQWRSDGGDRQVRPVATANVVAWTQGRIVFDNTALADAIDQINRYGGKPITLDAPNMKDERISGTFEVSDPQSFAAAVAAFLPLQQRAGEDGHIHLVARD